MPLYSDMYYSYLNNVPTSFSSSSPSSSSFSSSSSSYNSLSSYSPSYSSPYSPSVRNVAGVSRFMPKLTTISETPLSKHRLAALTRINASSNKTTTTSAISRRQSPKYVPPRPRRIDASDIDVSFTRFADRKLNESKSNLKVNEEITPSTSTTIFNEEQEDDENPQKNRSTIRRDRGLVRLRTIRVPQSTTSTTPITAKTVVDPKEQIVDIDPGYGSSERSSGSWRKKFELDFDYREKPLSPTTKTLGESFLEKYQIKEPPSKISTTPDVKIFLTLDDLPPERQESLRRKSNGKLPTFKEICSDISSDKLTDDLNAGELRRRASLIIEEEINKIRKSESGTIHCLLETSVNVESEDEQKQEDENITKKGKKIRQKLTAKTSIENPMLQPQIKAIIANVEIEETAFNSKKELLEDKNTTFKVPLKKKKKTLNTCDSEAVSSSSSSCVVVEEKNKKIAETNADDGSASSESLMNITDLNTKLLIDKSAMTAPSSTTNTVPGEQVVIKKNCNSVKLKSSLNSAVPASITTKTSRESKKMIPIRKDVSADDFWGMIGARETAVFTKRKKRVIEDQQLIILENAWIDENNVNEIEHERNAKLTKILENKAKGENSNKLNVDQQKINVKKDATKELSEKEDVSVVDDTQKISNATSSVKIPQKIKSELLKIKIDDKKIENVDMKNEDTVKKLSVNKKHFKIEEKTVPKPKSETVEYNEAVKKKEDASAPKNILKHGNIKKEKESILNKIVSLEKNQNDNKNFTNAPEVKNFLSTPLKAKKIDSEKKLENDKIDLEVKKALETSPIKKIDSKNIVIRKVDDNPRIAIKTEEFKSSLPKPLQQKPVAKILYGKATAKAPIEKQPIKVNDQVIENSLKIEKEMKETSQLLNESKSKPFGTLSKFPTLNNLNSISMNDAVVIEDNREITTIANKSNESEELIDSNAEQISIAIESSEATSNNQKQVYSEKDKDNKLKQEESASESETEESSYEESSKEESEEEEEEMGKKEFDPQKKVKIDFTKMQKLFKSDEKSNIKLVARPRPLWKIKRNRHAKFSDSETESTDNEVEEIMGGSTTGGSQSSTNSDKVVNKKSTAISNKKSNDSPNENIVALMQMLNVGENENEEDEAKKKSRFSTSSQDSGYSGMNGATAARSPRKALGEFFCFS